MPLAFAPLVAKIGVIDEVIDARPLQDLDPAVHNAEIAVNLHGCGPQSHRVLLRTQPHRLIAFEHAEIPQSARMPRWNPDEHETDRWCRLLQESGVPADPSELDIGINADPRYENAIVVHPGAASESRRWPVAKWIELATQLRKRGHFVVFTGSNAEFRRARHIAKSAGFPIGSVVAGRTRIDELGAIVAAARAVICGDTGVAHLATAVRTPSVILFGPTSPYKWGPPQRARHRIIWRGTLGDPHADVVDPGLASITVSEVLAELDALLDVPRAS
jgi:ADP-heptose:LPS heptosyltransferase